MCAISGIISPIADFQHASLLTPMLAAMRHRGPDGTEIEIFANTGCFGHNRLSIVDLNQRAKQPMWDASQRFCLTFNGEIYNFKALRDDLRALGHQFRTESDSEVLIQAWAEWGMNATQRLVGMFVFAVWDKFQQQLYLVRDRMGEKPLYYAPIQQNFQNGLVFASELKGLRCYPFIRKEISLTALSHYLSFNYTSTQDAILQGVHKLPPSSYLHYNFKTHEHTLREYWSLANCFQNKSTISYLDAKAEVEKHLSAAVKGQLIADVPLGAFLSGGIDSATIVSHMSKGHAQRINTYSIGFKEKSYNELPQSKRTAEHLKVHHQSQIISANIQDSLQNIIASFDEPFADTSLIPTYFLCQFAKQFVTVSLSGDGGDELFGGYVTYQADRYYQLFQGFPLPIRKTLFQLSQHLPTSFNKLSLDYKIKQFFQGNMLDFPQAHCSWREVFSLKQKKSLLQPELHHLLTEDSSQIATSWFKDVEDCHYLDQAMYVDMKTWLVDDIFTKVDRASMAHSLEVRAPFMDHRLVELAVSLPVTYKIKRRNAKRVLKASHQHHLPATLFKQKKRGFNSPVSHWLANELFAMAYEVTTSAKLSRWFDKSAIEKLWFEHKQGVCDNGYRLFNLLCLGLWCQIYDSA